MDLEASDRVVMCYTLEVVDMAGVAEESDMYMDILILLSLIQWIM